MTTPDRVEPEPGQESVWDYPRPPLLEPTSALVEVTLGGVTIVRTTRALRVLETSHPPTYYLPVDAFAAGSLVPAGGQSYCEWKGVAAYFDLVAGSAVAERAAWGYPHPTSAYEALRDHVAIYPSAMDACTVDGEVVTPQPGNFYGGWVTSGVVGPFKGVAGSRGW